MVKVRKGWTWDYFDDEEHIRVESPEGHVMQIPACVPALLPFGRPHHFIEGHCAQCGAPEDIGAGWPMVTLEDLIEPDRALKVENYGGIDRPSLVLDGSPMAAAAGNCIGVPNKEPDATARDRFDAVAKEVTANIMDQITRQELQDAAGDETLRLPPDTVPVKLIRVPRWKRIVRSPAAFVACYRLLRKPNTAGVTPGRLACMRGSFGLTKVMVAADRNPFEKPDQPTTLEGTEQ